MSLRTLAAAALLTLGVAGVGVGAAAGVVQSQAGVAEQLDAVAAAGQANAEGLAETRAAAESLAEQVAALGETPIVDPATLPTPEPIPAAPSAARSSSGAVTRAEVRTIAERVVAAQPGVSPERVARMISRAIRKLPDPEPGAPGADGEKGDPGPAGADGRTPTDAEILAVVQQVVAANPPAPGRDGADGRDGTDGRDGLSVTAVAIVGGRLIFTLSDGSTLDAGSLPDTEDGAPYCPPGTTQANYEGHFYDAPGGRARVLVCRAS